MQTRWAMGLVLALTVLAGGCMTIRGIGGAESCCDYPEECVWVAVKDPPAFSDERLFLCCSSPRRDKPHCTEVSWSTAAADWMD